MSQPCDHAWQTVYLIVAPHLEEGAYVGEARRCVRCARFDNSTPVAMAHTQIVDHEQDDPVTDQEDQ